MFEDRNLIQPKKDPFLLFEEWFEEAKLKEQNDPNAMNLSTISKDLKPSSRIVLLKSFFPCPSFSSFEYMNPL